MNSIWFAFISPVVLAGALRLSTPILWGSLGGCFTTKAGTFFIAYECLMLTSAFFSTLGSFITGNPLYGTCLGVLSALVAGGLFGLFSFHFHANPLIVGIAMNYGAWAVTTTLLKSIFGVRGAFIDPRVVSYQPINLPILDSVPIINDILNNQLGIVYLAFIMIPFCQILMYKTPYGLHIRGIGLNEKAAQNAGTNVLSIKWTTLMIMSVFLGVAGSYLPLSGVSMFTENMTSGRGFLCMAAVLVGKGDPVKTGLIAILFGYTSALYLTLTSFALPTQLISCIPYFAVIAVLIISGLNEKKKKLSI